MANWCNNYLTFSGAESDLKKVTELFKKMNDLEQETGEGQAPDFIKEVTDGYFFSIYQNSDDLGVFQYETKWSPNTAEVVKIAEHFNLSFILEYEEFGNDVFGKSKYNAQTKKLIENDLTNADFAEIEFDFDNDIYKFRGEEDETDRNFLETLYFERYNETY